MIPRRSHFPEARRRGFTLLELIIATAVGCILGDQISYWAGKLFGERLKTMWPLRLYPQLVAKGEDSTNGKWLRWTSGNVTIFGAHLSEHLASEGPTTPNQVIALTGATGRVTGPHIHLKTTINGSVTDPLTVFASSEAPHVA